MSEPEEAGDRGGVALFDLDGTLLGWDSQVLFCDHVLRRHGWRRLLLLPFFLALPLAPVLGTAGMKRVFLAYLWRLPRRRLDELAREFAAGWFPDRCFPELLAEIGRQRAAGRQLVLASASPELWVSEVGRRLGFDRALGTVVEFGARAPLFPALENHKGQAKVRRLRRLGIAPEGGVIPASHGYSDSRADLPMLALCEEVTVVNPGKELAALAESSGWRILRPELPWRGRLGKGWMFLRRIVGL